MLGANGIPAKKIIFRKVAVTTSGFLPILSESLPAKLSVGATLLPIMIVFFISHDLFYGLSFFVPAAIYFINGMVLLLTPFPNHKANKFKDNVKDYRSVGRGSSSRKTFKKIDAAGPDIYIVGRSGLFGLDEDIEKSWEIMCKDYEDMTKKVISKVLS
ncbi:hypothetical protein QFZ31_006825 [Neobacillus niacini]|uniref:hypothetical protein n=1 Tax=Neobacillus driksii TaxID=3035913 RepID=UPI002785D336|nr:hypothetical protein [Neobacillus niacini]MDQ0976773.1 hypothetical protein [Neobacillus niacini]